MLLGVDARDSSPFEAAWKTRRFGERKTATRMRYFLDQRIPLMVLLSNAE